MINNITSFLYTQFKDPFTQTLEKNIGNELPGITDKPTHLALIAYVEWLQQQLNKVGISQGLRGEEGDKILRALRQDHMKNAERHHERWSLVTLLLTAGGGATAVSTLPEQLTWFIKEDNKITAGLLIGGFLGAIISVMINDYKTKKSNAKLEVLLEKNKSNLIANWGELSDQADGITSNYINLIQQQLCQNYCNSTHEIASLEHLFTNVLPPLHTISPKTISQALSNDSIPDYLKFKYIFRHNTILLPNWIQEHPEFDIYLSYVKKQGINKYEKDELLKILHPLIHRSNHWMRQYLAIENHPLALSF